MIRTIILQNACSLEVDSNYGAVFLRGANSQDLLRIPLRDFPEFFLMVKAMHDSLDYPTNNGGPG